MRRASRRAINRALLAIHAVVNSFVCLRHITLKISNYLPTVCVWLVALAGTKLTKENEP